MAGSGKKWNAAEKHFQELELNLTRQNRKLEAENALLRETIKDLTASVATLTFEKAQLTDHVERLLSYTELSKADIQIACKKDKAMSEIAALLSFGKGKIYY